MTEKHLPEVGDVWEYQGKLYHISSVTDGIVKVWCKSSDDIMRKHNWVLSGFITVFKYLGKSKVSIKELFDVRD